MDHMISARKRLREKRGKGETNLKRGRKNSNQPKTALASSEMSLKLYIDKKSNRVLFAEAGKELIDFLFNFLALPVGNLIPLLDREVLSSFQNIYQSIPNFGDAYLQPNFIKDTLLKPKVYVPGGCSDSLQLPNVELSTPRKFYTCFGNSHRCVSNDKIVACPSCRSSMSSNGEIIDTSSIPSSVQQGYVKESVTYMVMDDLELRPLSSIGSIGTILNKFNVKDIGALEEKVVNLSMGVGLKLLKTSLHSSSVLNDVFLPMLKKEVEMEN